MVYSLVTIILVLATCVIFLPRFRKFVEQQNLAVNFVLTLVATLVGVLLAIAISNHEQDEKEKGDVAKLIRASIHSVETCYEYSEVLLQHYQTESAELVSQEDFFSKNPLPYPDYLDVFIMQALVSKNLSQASLSDLNELLINLKRSIERKPDIYLEMLEQTKQVLLIELLYQNGNIDGSELEQKLDAIEMEFIKTST